MIPKIIHYCWFGKGKKGELIEECLKSWKKYCPDYQIIEWNEDNIPINSNQYAREAYEAKKWAFVSDYARLYVLYNYGGIYMDTDVELIKPIDEYLNTPAFTGFETDEKIPTAIMGAEKHNEWIGYLLSYYENRNFYTKDGKCDTKTNVETITEMTKAKFPIQLDGTQQEIEGLFRIYPKEYFCPKDYNTGEIDLTNHTVCIHHFNASWFSKIEKKMRDKKVNYIKKYGKEIGERKYQAWCKRAKLEIHIRKYGIKSVAKNIFKKILNRCKINVNM